MTTEPTKICKMESYQARKARRIDKASQTATRCGRVAVTTLKGESITLEVRKAYRSRGYRTNYTAVLTYWVLSYDTAGLFDGRSFTAREFEKARAYVQEHQHVKLPA